MASFQKFLISVSRFGFASISVVIAYSAIIALAQENNSPQKQAPLQDSNTIQMADGQQSEAIDIQKFAWLEGSWDGGGLGGDCSEVWSSVAGDSIIGSFRFVADGKVQFTEHFQLKKSGNSVVLELKHFDDKLVGWEDKDNHVTFRFAKRNANSFCFDGLTYRRIDDDHMDAFVVISGENEEVKEEKFSFERRK